MPWKAAFSSNWRPWVYWRHELGTNLDSRLNIWNDDIYASQLQFLFLQGQTDRLMRLWKALGSDMMSDSSILTPTCWIAELWDFTPVHKMLGLSSDQAHVGHWCVSFPSLQNPVGFGRLVHLKEVAKQLRHHGHSQLLGFCQLSL